MPGFDRRFFLARTRTRLTPIIPRAQPRFLMIGERRYFERLPYALPIDPIEGQRLDFQHAVLRQLLHGNYVAPVPRPDAILDVGCGTGRWVRDMARDFPQANVVGLDILPPPGPMAGGEPITSSLVPENALYVQGNCLAGLPFASATFDFVHQRVMAWAIPRPQWAFVLRELVRVTRPRGWIELVEMDLPDAVTPASRAVAEWVNRLVARVQVDPDIGPLLEDSLHQAGVAQVQTEVVPVTLGAQGGQLGATFATNVLALLQGIRDPLVGRALTTVAEFELTLEQLRQDIETIPLTQRWYAVVGQKQ